MTPASRRRDRCARPRDERGVSLSAFFAVVVVCLLLVAGLVVDGGAKVAGDRRAEAVAAQAARAGADAMAVVEVAGADGRSEGRRAAQRVLDAHGVPGIIEIRGDTLQVETSLTVPVTFLSLIGVDELPASGRAIATAVAS